MSTENVFPKRVTGGEDGVYRWSYDIDLKEDHYMRNLLMKIILIVIGACCILPGALMLTVDGGLEMAWIPLAIGGFVAVLTQGVFFLYRKFLHNVCTMSYELDDTGIRMIRSQKEQRLMRGMAPAMLVLGAASGHAAQGFARGAMAAGMAEGARMRFSSVRRMKERPEKDMFVLRSLLVTLQVWAPAEDFELVKKLLREGTERNRRSSWYGTL